MFLFRRPQTALVCALPVLLLAVGARADVDPRPLLGLGAPATSIALSFDASQVVCSSANGLVQKWIPREKRFRSFFLPEIGGSQFSRTGPPEIRLAASKDRVLTINLPSYNGSRLFASRLSTRRIEWVHVVRSQRSVADANARRVAVWNVGSSIQVLDARRPLTPTPEQLSLHGSAPSRRFARQLPVLYAVKPKGSVRGAAFSPDARVLVTMGNTLEFWNARNGRAIANSASTPLSLSATAQIHPSPNGRFVAVVPTEKRAGFSGGFGGSGFGGGARPNVIAIWDTKAGTWGSVEVEPSRSFVPGVGERTEISFAWMPDSRSFWTGGAKIIRFRAEDLKPMRDLRISGPVAVSGDGLWLATRNIVRPNGLNGLLLWRIPADQ